MIAGACDKNKESASGGAEDVACGAAGAGCVGKPGGTEVVLPTGNEGAAGAALSGVSAKSSHGDMLDNTSIVLASKGETQSEA